jgi:hypothetical protein
MKYNFEIVFEKIRIFPPNKLLVVFWSGSNCMENDLRV